MSVRAIMAGSEAASPAAAVVPAVIFSRSAHQAIAPAAVSRCEPGSGAGGDRRRGEAFSAARRRALAGANEDVARDRIRRPHPEEYRALVLSWNEGSIMARSEAEAFTRQHRFLADMRRALETICT